MAHTLCSLAGPLGLTGLLGLSDLDNRGGQLGRGSLSALPAPSHPEHRDRLAGRFCRANPWDQLHLEPLGFLARLAGLPGQ